MPEGQLCFWKFSFLTIRRKRSIYFSRVQEIWRNSPCSERLQYQQIICWHSARKEKTDRVAFLKYRWDTSVDLKSENKYQSDLYFGDSRAYLFLSAITRAQVAILSLSSHGKILAESFQFSWKENIFFKLEKYIQPDGITTNQPSQSIKNRNHPIDQE